MKKSALLKILINVSLFLFLLIFTTNLSAQAKLSVQGLLKKSDGTSLPDGNYDLTFKFYDAEVGGSALEAVTVNTEVNGGVYSAVLSGFTNLTFAIPYYVSVAVNGGTELLPRIALTAAPYAISLQGQNNKFPSIGLVKADAIDVVGAVNAGTATVSGAMNAGTATVSGATNTGYVRADGGAPAGGVAGKGFSFKNGGDEDGGIFSYQDNQVSLYANAIEKVKVTGGLVELFGDVNTNKLTVYGALTSGDQTVNGNQQVNGNETVTGGSYIAGRVKTNGLSGGGGLTFNYAPGGGVDDTDSGIFGTGDGRVAVYSNGAKVAEFTQPQGYNNNTDVIESAIKFWGVQKGPNSPQVEWDLNTGELQVDNSSRKLKRNIRDMEEDFTKILKIQPKFYNRIGYPDSLLEAGYIAEEFDSLGLNHLVHYYANGEVFGIAYDRIPLYLTEIVKTHHAEMEKMKAEIAELRAANTALRAENDGLHSANTALQGQQAAFGKQLEGLSRRLQSLETAASHR